MDYPLSHILRRIQTSVSICKIASVFPTSDKLYLINELKELYQLTILHMDLSYEEFICSI